MSERLTDPFDAAFVKLMEHEGGYIDDPDDPGGATNMGISQRFLNKTGLNVSVKDITRNQAKNIYREYFWNQYGYSRFDDDLAIKLFDIAVNTGPRMAHRLLQRACRATDHPVAEDGLIGPETLQTVRKLTATGPGKYALLAAFRSEVAGYYRALVERVPMHQKYLRGWLARAYD